MKRAWERVAWLLPGTLLAIALVVPVFVWPGWGTYLRIISVLVFVLLSLGPGIVIAVVTVVSVRRGLILRDGKTGNVARSEDSIVVERGASSRRVRWSDIDRARVAENDNWTASRIVTDAVSLLDARGAVVAKFPLEAPGGKEVLARLEDRGVEVEPRAIEGPAYLD
jgi:hypothetical protein